MANDKIQIYDIYMTDNVQYRAEIAIRLLIRILRRGRKEKPRK